MNQSLIEGDKVDFFFFFFFSCNLALAKRCDDTATLYNIERECCVCFRLIIHDALMHRHCTSRRTFLYSIAYRPTYVSMNIQESMRNAREWLSHVAETLAMN